MTGFIRKAISGFYYCVCDGKEYECHAKGAFRSEKITPLVGDRASFILEDDGRGYITAILPRKNEFARPPIANIDRLFLVSAVMLPSPSPFVLDQLIAVCEYKKIDPVIVITKTDLGDSHPFADIYRKAGFPVITVCNHDSQDENGFDTLRGLLKNSVSALCGNTGVGKSSLLNRLFPSLGLSTGDISKKLGRGRHTTRAVELFYLPELNAYVADTPGFGTMELSRYDAIKKEELADCFREFAPYLGGCQFRGCSHTAEKGCAVLEAVRDGKIAQSRLDSYISLYKEAKERKDWETPKN